MQMSPNRVYPIADATLLTEARSQLSQYERAQESFAHFNPGIFTQSFLSSYAARVKQAESLPSDNLCIGLLAEATEKLEHARCEAVVATRLLRHFATIAFAKEPEQLNRFAFGAFQKARRQRERFRTLFDEMVRQAEALAAPLASHHYSDVHREELQRINEHIQELSAEQQSAKNRRTTHAQQRVEGLNALWTQMKQISEAAKILYRYEPERQALFALPKPTKKH